MLLTVMGTTLSDIYDKLLHIAKERHDLTEAQVFNKAKELFPNLSQNEEDHYYEKYINETVIDTYSYYRSCGNSIRTSAHSLELSETLLKEALVGKGLSFNMFVELVSAEMFATAEMKVKHFRNIEEATDSLLFLRTAFPEEYRPEALTLKASVSHTFDGDVEKELKRRGIPIPQVDIGDLNE